MSFNPTKIIFLFFVLLTITLGCKKEVDSPAGETETGESIPSAPNYIDTLVPCELCAYADSLEGIFGGIGTAHYGSAMGGFDGGGIDGPQDSVFVQLRHVFKQNAGAVIDSIHMFIELRSWIKNDPYFLIDTIGISDRTGHAFGGHYPQFKPYRDSVSIQLYETHFQYDHIIDYKGFRLN